MIRLIFINPDSMECCFQAHIEQFFRFDGLVKSFPQMELMRRMFNFVIQNHCTNQRFVSFMPDN
jgi:hypothetical protein